MEKSGEKWEKVGKGMEKWEQIGKSGERWGKVFFFNFGCPKITFDHSSCHFRSIRNFFFWNFWTKWPPAAILDWTTMSVIELVRDIWMNNACVKFEERSLNPSKVIALTTKLWRGGGGGRWRRGGGGCVVDENIISPKTYVSREYNKVIYSYTIYGYFQLTTTSSSTHKITIIVIMKLI